MLRPLGAHPDHQRSPGYIVPVLGNFFVSIFKDSAFVSVITMRDLMFSGQLLASATDAADVAAQRVEACVPADLGQFPSAIFASTHSTNFAVGQTAGRMMPAPASPIFSMMCSRSARC